MAHICITSNSPDSIMNFRLDLINTLINRNHHVTILGPTDPEIIKKFPFKEVCFYDLKFGRRSINPSTEMATIFKFFYSLKKICPDVLLNFTIKPSIYGSLAAKLLGIQKVYSCITGLGYVYTGHSLKHRVLKSITNRLYRSSLSFNKKVFLQNNDDANLFYDSKILQKSKAVILPGSGVNLKKFKRTMPPKYKHSFIMVSRLLVDKGIREYVEASKKLFNKYNNVRCFILGPIDDNPASITQTELKSWSDSKAITYISKKSDVRPYLEQCEVFVLPSYREGTPKSVLEAMSMEMPIITTDVPGCKETIAHKKQGLLVPAKSGQALFNAMEYFVQNPHQIAVWGKSARNVVQKKFDVNIVNDIILNTLGI